MGKHGSNAQKVKITDAERQTVNQLGDTVQIDLEKSKVHWKGTKMRGATKHEGEVELKSGYFISNRGELMGGSFIVDMLTIGVTDIPKSDSIPIRNINEHLKSADFFEVEKFPVSEFHITRVRPVAGDSLAISGNLVIKNSTKHIVFGARYSDHLFSSTFTIDRFNWNIGDYGSWVEKKF